MQLLDAVIVGGSIGAAGIICVVLCIFIWEGME